MSPQDRIEALRAKHAELERAIDEENSRPLPNRDAVSDLKPATVRARADVVYANSDLAAPISSGSFKTIGMVVAPCSIRSMAEIASGVTTTLLSRAADVVLKERRRLVLLVRETPLHTGHLRTMTALSEMGAVIAPPVPAFYAKPQTLEEMIDQTLGRVLDLFALETGLVRRWGEPSAEDVEGAHRTREKPRRGME